MNGTTHRLGGLAVGAGIAAITIGIGGENLSAVEQTVSFIAGSAIGSLLPDIDHEGSLIGRKVKLVSKAVRKVAGHRGATHTIVGLGVYTCAMILLCSLTSSSARKGDFNSVIACLVGMIFSASAVFVIRELSRIFRNRISRKKVAIVSVLSFIIGFAVTTADAKLTALLITNFLIGSVAGYASHLFLDCFTVSGVELFAPFTDKTIRLGTCRTGSDWRNHKHGDTKEDRKKARGFGESFYAMVCTLIFICNIGLIFYI